LLPIEGEGWLSDKIVQAFLSLFSAYYPPRGRVVDSLSYRTQGTGKKSSPLLKTAMQVRDKLRLLRPIDAWKTCKEFD
jgi:hypothetical protein